MRTISAAILALALASCGSTPTPTPTPTPAPTPAPTPTPTPTPTPPPSTERDISPASTNPAITSNISAHVAINPDPAVTARGRLFVMLPGTGAVPRFYRLVVRTGAQRGYHAIGLTYPNDVAVDDLCGAGATANCSGDTRREIITGIDTSPAVSVDQANSITGRLRALLVFLNTSFPAEGWNQFLRGGEPDWRLITVAGHSQGAGHAGYMAKLHDLDGVAMFAGPGDVGTGGAAWLTLPNITPVDRQYGFAHTADPLVPQALLTFNWTRIGLSAFGPPVSVDGATAPFGNSHQLLTSLPPPASTLIAPAHSAMIVDAATPLAADGTPVYRPVWIYMAFR